MSERDGEQRMCLVIMVYIVTLVFPLQKLLQARMYAVNEQKFGWIPPNRWEMLPSAGSSHSFYYPPCTSLIPSPF